MIGLTRLGTTQVSVLDPSPRWAQFLPQKGWVIERSCVRGSRVIPGLRARASARRAW